MKLRTFRPITSLPRPPRARLSVEALVPLALLALMTAPLPAPFSPVSFAHAQNQLWLTQFGTSGEDRAWALAPDGAAGLFVAGSTEGILGGQSAGGSDTFLARHDSAGNQLWIRQFGSGLGDGAIALAPANGGGIFIAGSQGKEAFVAHYDSAGNRLWIHTYGSILAAAALALTPDGAGGVFVGGFTWGAPGGPPAIKADAFLARHDGAGNQIWYRQWGTSAFDEVSALAPDGTGGVIAAGIAADYFVWHYNAAGERLWTRFIGDVGAVSSLVPDGEGGVMAAGWTSGTPGGPNAGGFDAFLARLDSAGNQIWVRQFGTSGNDLAHALVSDGSRGVFVAGSTWGNLAGPNAGRGDAFLARHDEAGNQLWIRQFGTAEHESAEALALDGAGGVMVAGSTYDSLGGPSAGGLDAFMARYTIDSCYADCDTSTGIGVLDIFDFLCFQNSFVNSEPYACDCNTSTGSLVCDVFDFLCFQNSFLGGCP